MFVQNYIDSFDLENVKEFEANVSKDAFVCIGFKFQEVCFISCNYGTYLTKNVVTVSALNATENAYIFKYTTNCTVLLLSLF